MRNLLTILRNQLPKTKRLIGAVVAHNPDDTSTIQVNNGVFRARGQSVPVGQQAEILDGAVQGQMPTLPTVVIEV